MKHSTVILGFVIISVGVAVLAGCGSGSPKSVIESFLRAARLGRDQAMLYHFIDEHDCERFMIDFGDSKYSSWEFRSESVKDESADVTGIIRSDRGTAGVVFHLRKSGGNWRISGWEQVATVERE